MRERERGRGGIKSTRCVCVCESRLMKWFVTSLMTKGTRFHRQGITDVKTNLAPLKGFKGSFVMGWGGGR